MSLSQRVTSFESLSPERGRSPAGSQRRKLSFSPLPGNWGDDLEPREQVVEEIETVAAFEVSKGKRICKYIGWLVALDAQAALECWAANLYFFSLV